MQVQLSATLTLLSLTLNTVVCVLGESVQPLISAVPLRTLAEAEMRLPCPYSGAEAVVQVGWSRVKANGNIEHIIIYDFTEGVKEFAQFVNKMRFEALKPVKDLTLLILSTEKSDEATYSCKITTFPSGTTESRIQLTVRTLVVAPTLTVVSNWSSGDSCNVTLKCTGLNVSLISSCNGTFCSQEGGDRFLSISFNHTTVSCNHSNPVSWKQKTVEFEPFCPLYKAPLAPPAGISPCLLKALLMSVGLIVMVTAVITVHIRDKLHKTK